jgi:uncharacterized membrane protein YgdD (TMEM256/DUF423 family)
MEIEVVQFFAVMACLSGFASVALGAFAAHGLEARLPAADLATFEVGVRYQMYHALALLSVALVLDRWPGTLGTWAGWSFLVGTLLFSGSLYLLVLTGPRTLGAVTPFGGVAFLLGWALLGLHLVRSA